MLDTQFSLDAIDQHVGRHFRRKLADAPLAKSARSGRELVQIERRLLVWMRFFQRGDDRLDSIDRHDRLQPNLLDALELARLSNRRVRTGLTKKRTRPVCLEAAGR